MKTLGFLLLMIVFIVVLSNIAVLVNSNNGIPDVLTRLFPEKYVNKEDQAALQTGMAPFAEAENAAQPEEIDPAIKYNPLGDSINVTESLEIQHRHEAAVSKWATDAVSDILNFGTDSYQERKATVMAELMSPNALKEFDAFLEESHIISHMSGNGYELKGFVTDVPAMRGSGPVSGRFRWVYDLPVNLTFLPAGSHSYKDLAENQYQFEALTFRIQIGRVPEGGRDGMIIETWEALPREKQ